MTLAEAIETTRIHRVAGLTGNRTALVTTRPSKRSVGAAEVTEGVASPGCTAPPASIFGLRCREAMLDALVLQRWRHLFSPHGDESAWRSAPRLMDAGGSPGSVCRQAIPRQMGPGAGAGPWLGMMGVSPYRWATPRPQVNGPVRPADDPPDARVR
jgi:hypothetical protein